MFLGYLAPQKIPERIMMPIFIVPNAGLSNFNIIETKRILEIARIPPSVNQREIHPILLMAHQPLGGRPLDVVRGNPDTPLPTEDPKACTFIVHFIESFTEPSMRGDLNGESDSEQIKNIATRYDVSTAQATHMTQNIHLKRLREGDLRLIDQLSSQRLGGPARFLDPSRHLGVDIFDEQNDQPADNHAPWD
ncbi:hypothetical protein N7478_009511 [Penicillium angulare]|uniref:uncharacterized protein n=1 Tax=Penicillium angulare TaxID=116970 RepID=UPI00254260B8|nr:uncharacterized protein N7478_009511 [Penicillium angulare]KAJ5266703.1 hypothetical protein N7478_009511 [Penicillium angulare]